MHFLYTYLLLRSKSKYHANDYFTFNSDYLIKILCLSILILILTLRKFWIPKKDVFVNYVVFASALTDYGALKNDVAFT